MRKERISLVCAWRRGDLNKREKGERTIGATNRILYTLRRVQGREQRVIRAGRGILSGEKGYLRGPHSGDILTRKGEGKKSSLKSSIDVYGSWVGRAKVTGGGEARHAALRGDSSCYQKRYEGRRKGSRESQGGIWNSLENRRSGKTLPPLQFLSLELQQRGRRSCAPMSYEKRDSVGRSTRV